MGQITIYMDDSTLKKIELAAKKDHDSVSKWVKKRLLRFLEGGWPNNYFNVFGSVGQKELHRPDQPKWDKDIRRESL